MWSQIYPSTVCRQLYTLWLTLYFTDLCRLVYILSTLPPLALAYPSSQARFMRDHALWFLIGIEKVTSILIFLRICSNINYLVEGDKWYAISCHISIWNEIQILTLRVCCNADALYPPWKLHGLARSLRETIQGSDHHVTSLRGKSKTLTIINSL